MKNSIIFVLFCLSLLIFGCGDGGKSEKTADNGNDSGRETGSLYGECYPNETCDKGLECDVENNICIKKPNENNNDQNDSENDNSDTMSYEDDDISDISSEQNDDTVDTKDDSDNSITDDSDSATETPCKPNPCVNVENSTGTCTPIDETRYSCWCKANYTWDSSTKTCKNDSNNNSDDKSPCKPNPCVNIENSTGTCTPIDETKYSCWCKANYTWNESSCIADSRTVDCTGLPANARWNTTSIITQTWNGTIWTPSATAIYSEEKSENECHFLCSSQDEWDGFQCKPQQEEKLVSLGNICSGLKDCSDNSKSLYPCPTISEDFFGQDANYANSGCIQHKFSIDSLFEEEKIIIDNNTFLEWQQTTSNLEYSFTEAINYCNNLIYAGYSDWRLPTPQELLSLSYEYLRPVQFFPNIYINLWSSKTYVLSNTDQAFYYYYGSIHLDSTTSTHNVMCVRGNEMQTAYFSTTDTNVLTDATTGLMWQRAFVSKSWQEALSYCETLDEGGYTDWRLPNKNELASLINYDKYGPASDHIYTPINHLWSSSTSIDNRYAWTVNFYSGIVESKNKTESNNLHCVRSYICDEGYLWNGSKCVEECIDNYHYENEECVSDTKTNVSCILLPENATWNSVSEITQTWNGTEWTPSEVGAYDTISSNNECHFKCNNNYVWNESTHNCDAKQRTKKCTGLIDNAEWNSVSQITQTWNGTEWIPSEVGSYKKLKSTKRCYFKCSEGYIWKDSQCQKQVAGSVSLGNICTNQKSCYKDYNYQESSHTTNCSTGSNFGQDAYYASLGFCLPQTLVLENNVVKDANTGLQWKRGSSSCSGNWRDPTPQELLTIAANNIYNPALYKTYFEDVSSADFLYTPKKYLLGDNNFVLKLYDGSMTYLNISNLSGSGVTLSHLCVYGNSLPAPTFTTYTIGEDDVVLDSASGLMWQQAYAEDKGWNEALSYCENLEYAGYNDWRLPNKNELASLINYDKCKPASDFPDMPSDCFFSSSTYVEAQYYAWSVDFRSGIVFNGSKEFGNYNVRCVRSNICDENELWNGSEECFANPCHDNPCADDANSTGECVVLHNLIDYACECNDGFRWNGSECQDSSTIPLTLGNICTNQKKCYNNDSYMQNCPAQGANFYGQDAQYAADGTCMPQSFIVKTISNQNVVEDLNTVLMWQQDVSNLTWTWEKAVSYCSSLSYAGYNDWRLPDPAEFQTIVDLNQNTGLLPFDHNYFFPTMYYDNTRKFWMSQEYKTDKSKAYYSGTGVQTKTNTFNVICVRGNYFLKPVFIVKKVNGDSIVIDSATNLMWQKTYIKDVDDKAWKEALSYCENLEYAGYSDWRLPNKNELASLLNHDKSEAPYSDFPDMPSEYFWSSTSSTSLRSDGTYAVYAVCVNFNQPGATASREKTEKYKMFVRCVRNAD